MPVTPHEGSRKNVPESMKKVHGEMVQNLAALQVATEAGDSELEAELKAKHNQLFQMCAEEAKRLNSTRNTKKPRPQPREVPESLKEIHEELKQVAPSYNKAVIDGDHELANELRPKLNELRQKCHEDPKFQSLAATVEKINVEIYNRSNYKTLRNSGGWDVKHGWFYTSPVGDVAPHGTDYVHTGGSIFEGIDMTFYFNFDGEWPIACHFALLYDEWWHVYWENTLTDDMFHNRNNFFYWSNDETIVFELDSLS